MASKHVFPAAPLPFCTQVLTLTHLDLKWTPSVPAPLMAPAPALAPTDAQTSNVPLLEDLCSRCPMGCAKYAQACVCKGTSDKYSGCADVERPCFQVYTG
ncbi:hypothetical protein GW7_10536 [Heterocephalus glaber]|uniref:Metallothionein n=1 Tax=Heterocephalus glaber TaxID=10181 RepID=G5ANL9_HETGA|nr:hypothetical protein GW7_10536 [Heterocephalus glaber]